MRPEETLVTQPIRSLQTMLRVISQQEGDLLSLIPDGIYGPSTTAAVSRYQQNHGLPITGITNQETWDHIVRRYNTAIVEVSPAEPLYLLLNPNQVYRKGDASPNLYVVQGVLMALSDTYGSISPPGITGILDDATQDSLISFQQMTGLPMDGNLDKTTWKHLALHFPMTAVVIP